MPDESQDGALPAELPMTFAPDRPGLHIPPPEPTHLAGEVMMDFHLPRPHIYQVTPQVRTRIIEAWDGAAPARELQLTDKLIEALEGSEASLEIATDALNAWIAGKLRGVKLWGPIGIPTKMVEKILDRLMPGIIIGPLKAVLTRIGAGKGDSEPS